MASGDGPLGKAPDIDVGFSDAVLLAVSFAGFCALAVSIYSIVLAKLKTAEELRAEEEEREISYDERLVGADVSKLNRAQRRARAKHIMKQRRRQLQGGPQNQHHEDLEPLEDEADGEPLMLLRDENVPEFREDSHLHNNNSNARLSRRERQRAAKKVELRERRLLEGDRREEQRKAQATAAARKKEREILRASEADHRRREREIERTAREREAHRAWRIFLETPTDDDDDEQQPPAAAGGEVLTVREWISELRERRIARTRDLADRFRVDEAVVIDRIRRLLDESRLSGMLETTGGSDDDDDDDHRATRFIYLSPEDMSELGTFVKSRDRIAPGDLARRIEEQLRLPGEGVSPAAE